MLECEVWRLSKIADGSHIFFSTFYPWLMFAVMRKTYRADHVPKGFAHGFSTLMIAKLVEPRYLGELYINFYMCYACLWYRYNMIYSPVICYIAIETGPFIDDLLIKNGDFPWFSMIFHDFP